ncbi:MAG: hypothetical protein IIC28_08050 [Chloroflexi bacterium]|nr:hypothetical protein [Chloroflexota bacterium]MCH8115828.1 hypothetical protein [Chloroflexota bacterium]MCI0834179.1 hypothetical protein [Chloroflexota bacterium]
MENRLSLKGGDAIGKATSLEDDYRSQLISHLETIRNDPTRDPRGKRVVTINKPPIVFSWYEEDGWRIVYNYWYDRTDKIFSIAVYDFECDDLKFEINPDFRQ